MKKIEVNAEIIEQFINDQTIRLAELSPGDYRARKMALSITAWKTLNEDQREHVVNEVNEGIRDRVEDALHAAIGDISITKYAPK